MCAVASLLVFASCDKNDDCSFALTGDCLVEEISLDNYNGTVDLVSRTVVVRVPATYDVKAMKVTGVKVSDGAQVNIKEGMVLNMENDKNLHVTNGSRYFDMTLTVRRDEAEITAFVINNIYPGIIDEKAATVDVFVPGKVDVTKARPTFFLSEGATCDRDNDTPLDFSRPVSFTVKNNTAEKTYMVTVHVIDKPKALFVGAAADMSKLDNEAYSACMWMVRNMAESMYVSFEEIKNGNVNLSECKVIWWHFHYDGGVDGHDPFIVKAPEALAAKDQLKAYYENGGNFFLTRYASILPPFLGAANDPNDEWATPNNCWGGNEDSAERCGGPWDFNMTNASHPLFNGIVKGADPNKVYCTDEGYYVTNSTAQYHIGTDWGDYANDDVWKNRTGAEIIAKGGDGAIVAWEFPAKNGKGKILCIGSGCYDWFSYKKDDTYQEKYHENISIMTKNAFDYLTK